MIPVIALWNGKIVWCFVELQPADYKKNLCVLLDKILLVCSDPELNQGPLDLQSNALPTEQSRLRRDDLTYHPKCCEAAPYQRLSFNFWHGRFYRVTFGVHFFVNIVLNQCLESP